MSTELIHDAPSKTVGLSAAGVHLLLIDDANSPSAETKPEAGLPSSPGHWKVGLPSPPGSSYCPSKADEYPFNQSLGYAHVAQVQTLKVLIDLRDYEPRLKVCSLDQQPVTLGTRQTDARLLQIDVVRLRVQAQFCPDSLATLAAIIGDLSKVAAK